MRYLPTLLLLGCGFITSAGAQTLKMASVYTNLKNDCQAEEKVVADEVPLICKAVGGYRARVIPAGVWAETLEIVDLQGRPVTSLGTHGYGYTTSGRRLLEWRLANGRPFAVIFRVDKFNSEASLENGESPYLDKYKIG